MSRRGWTRKETPRLLVVKQNVGGRIGRVGFAIYLTISSYRDQTPQTYSRILNISQV